MCNKEKMKDMLEANSLIMRQVNTPVFAQPITILAIHNRK